VSDFDLRDTVGSTTDYYKVYGLGEAGREYFDEERTLLFTSLSAVQDTVLLTTAANELWMLGGALPQVDLQVRPESAYQVQRVAM
jgi:hypothetical protein